MILFRLQNFVISFSCFAIHLTSLPIRLFSLTLKEIMKIPLRSERRKCVINVDSSTSCELQALASHKIPFVDVRDKDEMSHKNSLHPHFLEVETREKRCEKEQTIQHTFTVRKWFRLTMHAGWWQEVVHILCEPSNVW